MTKDYFKRNIVQCVNKKCEAVIYANSEGNNWTSVCPFCHSGMRELSDDEMDALAEEETHKSLWNDRR